MDHKASHKATPWASDEVRTAKGFGAITTFFKPPPPKPKAGRPPAPELPPKKRGRPPQSEGGETEQQATPAEPATPAALSTAPVFGKKAAAELIGVKLERINWGVGEGLERMTKAVNDWDAKSGPFLEENKLMSIREYAAAVEIPHQTLARYACKDAGKRRQLSSSVGRKPLFDPDLEHFAVDVIRRHDRGNDGFSKRECVDTLHDLRPDLKRKAVVQAFDRTVRPKYTEELTGIIKASATTVKRTAITVAQQFRWHSTVDQALTFLREKNTGRLGDGRTFGEVFDHFVCGGDETCFLASAGDVKIIGDKAKPKHDLPTGSDRTSITVYRVGFACGATGPTAFLPAGQRRKAGYTDEFLVKSGAPPGSTIVMTPTGYMTEDAWLQMAPTIADGIRTMPLICEKPDWWVLKFIDGFGPHTSSEAAMQIYADKKIILVKEEGDSSHVCQAYDQKTAIDDKKSMRQALAYLRQSNKLVKGTIDGWQLVHVALSAVRELDKSAWVYSFDKVNLKPSTRVSFSEWIKRISHYIQGGESSFKPEMVRDPYSLLGAFWHGMLPAEKKLALSIVESHEHSFSVECVKELIAKVHVPVAEMQNLRVAIELAIKDPSHLERGKPEVTEVLMQPLEVQTAQAQVASITTGLVSFMLHPKAADGSRLLSGLALFDHMVNLTRRSVPTGTDLVPHASLSVEYSAVQQRLINPRAVDYTMHEIAKHAHGDGAKQAMAKRKLDNLGYFRGESGFANDPDRRRRLQAQLGLMKSLAEISKEEQNAKAATASLASTKLIEDAPAALEKLKQNCNELGKLYIPELCAIAFKHFKGTVLKGNKTAMVKVLTDMIRDQPAVLQLKAVPAPLPTPTLLDSAAAAATAPKRVTKGTKATDESSEDESIEDESSEDESSEDESSENETPQGYNVAQILKQKGKGKDLRFLVDWEGYGQGDQTWEPLANVKNCDAYKTWRTNGCM